MISATPSVQVQIVDLLTNPQSDVLMQQGGTVPIACASGFVRQDVVLAAGTSLAPLLFPAGVTTALVIIVAALNVPDLKINLFGNPIPIPQNQGLVLYGLTSAQVSLSTVIGGQVLYGVGG